MNLQRRASAITLFSCYFIGLPTAAHLCYNENKSVPGLLTGITIAMGVISAAFVTILFVQDYDTLVAKANVTEAPANIISTGNEQTRASTRRVR